MCVGDQNFSLPGNHYIQMSFNLDFQLKKQLSVKQST